MARNSAAANAYKARKRRGIESGGEDAGPADLTAAPDADDEPEEDDE